MPRCRLFQEVNKFFFLSYTLKYDEKSLNIAMITPMAPVQARRSVTPNYAHCTQETSVVQPVIIRALKDECKRRIRARFFSLLLKSPMVLQKFYCIQQLCNQIVQLEP